MWKVASFGRYLGKAIDSKILRFKLPSCQSNSTYSITFSKETFRFYLLATALLVNFLWSTSLVSRNCHIFWTWFFPHSFGGAFNFSHSNHPLSQSSLRPFFSLLPAILLIFCEPREQQSPTPKFSSGFQLARLESKHF